MRCHSGAISLSSPLMGALPKSPQNAPPFTPREVDHMASIRLTAAAVDKLLPPATGRTDVYDAEVPGLVPRMSASGTKSWSFTYRANGKPRRLTPGEPPGV